MERRAFLAAAAATPAGLVSARAAPYDGLPDDVGAAIARFRNSIPSNFDRDYVEHAVIPFFLTSIYEGERPALPMIDVTLSKEPRSQPTAFSTAGRTACSGAFAPAADPTRTSAPAPTDWRHRRRDPDRARRGHWDARALTFFLRHLHE